MTPEAPKTTPARRKPQTYKPPYAAYGINRDHRKSYATAIIGVQCSAQEDGLPLVDELLGMFRADKIGRPLHVEQAEYVDSDGYHNHILMPYWADFDHMNKFFGRDDFEVWRRTSRTGPVGHTEQEEEQYHDFMGSMRDRVPGYLSGEADGPSGKLVRQQPVESRGRHLVIEDLPHNLCYIRGPFGYKHAPREQQEAFHEVMMPVLVDAAQYLSNNSVESGCISARQLDEVYTGFNNQTDVEILGWFLTLQDLERWTEHHPSHLKILREQAKFHSRFDYQSVINQGHEVFVVPQGQVQCEYVKCHPNTGFLPYFRVRGIS